MSSRSLLLAVQQVLPPGAPEAIVASGRGWFCTAERLSTSPKPSGSRLWTIFANAALERDLPRRVLELQDLAPTSCLLECRVVRTRREVLFAIASSIYNGLLAPSAEHVDSPPPLALTTLAAGLLDVSQVLHISHVVRRSGEPLITAPSLGRPLQLPRVLSWLFARRPDVPDWLARGDALGFRHAPVVRSFAFEHVRCLERRLTPRARRGLELLESSNVYQDALEVFALSAEDVSAVRVAAEELAALLVEAR